MRSFLLQGTPAISPLQPTPHVWPSTIERPIRVRRETAPSHAEILTSTTCQMASQLRPVHALPCPVTIHRLPLVISLDLRPACRPRAMARSVSVFFSSGTFDLNVHPQQMIRHPPRAISSSLNLRRPARMPIPMSRAVSANEKKIVVFG